MSSQEVADRSFSLAYALQSIARDAGYSIDGDDLHAALGLSFMVCAAAEDDLSSWSMFARDVFLVEAGRLFGLSLREVHPPEAACGLDHFEAFRQHFDASYRPLIQRALENDQPVLAWRGWPGDLEAAWGIIRRITDRGVGVAGVVVTSAEASADVEEVDLVSPPVQLYVVETTAPHEPADDDLLTMALEHARAVLNGEPGSRFSVVMGLTAYDAWMARIGQLDSADGRAEDIAKGHAALAASVVAGHQIGIRFLQRRLERGAPDARPLITSLTAACHKIVTALSMSLDAAAVGAMLGSSDGRARLVGQLTDAREAAVDLLSALESQRKSTAGG